ncbi:MAG TPA: DUF1573 domain-containing protein [Candidatus Gracilibacteria bacterium]|nr:DUF1573 domain-containing protein [Candidatus Gracilibacteria bacterium]
MVVLLGLGTVIAQSGPGDASDKQTTQTQQTSNTQSQAQLPASAGTLEADKQEFSFGDIPIYGGKVSTNFTLTNSGTGPVLLKSITTSCMCTQATIDGKTFGMHINSTADITLQPKESKTMTVTFDPLAHGDTGTGPITRTISILTDSTATPAYQFKITGDVVKP